MKIPQVAYTQKHVQGSTIQSNSTDSQLYSFSPKFHIEAQFVMIQDLPFTRSKVEARESEQHFHSIFYQLLCLQYYILKQS